MPKMNTDENPSTVKRELLNIQFITYKRIVERKHGITVPLTADAANDLLDEELMSYVDSLKDMAHLPPS